MPTVSVDRDELYRRLGCPGLSVPAFEELCFAFGVELDDVLTSEQAAAARQHSEEVAPTEEGAVVADGAAAAAAAGSKVLYYIATPANRSDLLCIEGLARAFNIFQQRMTPPTYTLVPPPPSGGLTMTVAPSTQAIRPFVVCAVLRDMTFTPARYASFIDLQDKLHHNICRRRTLVAIGTHDLDMLTPPFRYEALPPSEIEFVPLSQRRSFRADALIDFYRTDASVKHIKPYVDIIAHSPVFPVIKDARGTVLSLPPLINGDHSKITLGSRNVLIECTATDLAKAHVVLNTMVTMFSEYAAKPFTVEPVSVVYEEAVQGVCAQTTPDLSEREAVARMRNVCSLIGAPVAVEVAAELSSRMQLPATAAVDESGEPILRVSVPPTRSDVLHECDVIEDVAIAYGYNNIVRTLPKTATTGAQAPVNKLTDALRMNLAAAGYDEVLTMALVSKEENFDLLLRKDDGKTAVELANPKTEDFQIGRTTLLPGLLKSVASNRGTALAGGLKVFEVSDVMLLDASVDVGARNERRLAALYTGPTAGFEIIHGLVDRVMALLEVPHRPFAWATPADSAAASGSATASFASAYGRGGLRFYIEAEEAAGTYFPGRGARIVLQREDGSTTVIGTLGVLHPTVLKNFDLVFPVSVVEMNIEPFVHQ